MNYKVMIKNEKDKWDRHLNFTFHLMKDGSVKCLGEKWEVPILVDPDNPHIQRFVKDGLIKLEDFKPPVEKKVEIKKEI